MYLYNIHNVLSIRSDKSLNTKYIEIPDVFLTDEIKEPNIVVKVCRIKPEHYLSGERVGDKYRWGENWLYLDWGLPSIVGLQAVIKGLDQPMTELIFSPLFWKFGDVSYIIGATISIHLLRYDITPVHAACISFEGKNILITGLSNMGKTSTVLNLLSISPEAQLYGDDTVLFGNDRVYSFPRAVGISPKTDIGSIGLSGWQKLTKKVQDNLLRLPVFSAILGNRSSINVKQKMIDSCRPEICYFLREGSPDIQELDKSTAVKLLYDTTQTLIHFRTNAHHSICTYSYMKKDLDLFELEKKRRLIISNLLDNVECYEIFSNKKGGFAEIIRKHISKS